MALQHKPVIIRDCARTLLLHCVGLCGNMSMQRVQFTISPSYNGWQLRDELRNRDWFARRDDALQAADTMAGARHALTGIPTAVVIEDGTGKPPVLCVQHG